jgi:aspartyl-tRNA(Asn)/glutamyl-tRNA(Gln) amidotransferase subunit A
MRDSLDSRFSTRRRTLAALISAAGAAAAAGLGLASRAARGADSSADAPVWLDLAEAARLLRARSVSSVELTRSCLERISRLNSKLNAYITVTAEQALTQARRADAEIARGAWRGAMHGIPIALKDNIDTARVKTTAASAVFANRVPASDADVVRRLNAAGAVMLGKLNMHEFALGTTSAISHYGPVRNPFDTERIAGGSSGGSAAAVAAGLCIAAVGTDTGGSIRIPAACCGIVGLKATLGVVSTAGVIPVSQSFDHVGPMCRTVGDAALMFQAMTNHPVAKGCDPAARPAISGLRIGVLDGTGYCDDSPTDPEVYNAFAAALAVMRPMVASIEPAAIPMPELGQLIDAESYAFHVPLLKHSAALYDSRTRATILEGAGVGPNDVSRLRRALVQHRAAVRQVFADVDLLVLPTLPVLPPRIDQATAPFALAACTFAFSLGGLPSISVPCGFSRDGLPIGLLISGPALSEARVLALAAAYESASGSVSLKRIRELRIGEERVVG